MGRKRAPLSILAFASSAVIDENGQLQPIPAELAGLYSQEMWERLAARIHRNRQVRAIEAAEARAAVNAELAALRALAKAPGHLSAATRTKALNRLSQLRPSRNGRPRKALGAKKTSGNSIAVKLRQLRKQFGMTQAEVAAAIKRSQAFVSRCETGAHPVSADELAAYSLLFGSDIAES